MNILEIKRMDYCYKQQFVLKDFELTVKTGAMYGLVGKPKSGKTTVLKLILGLLRTTSPTIYLKGQNVFGCRDKIRLMVGDVIDLPYYQNFLTVKENFKYIDMYFGHGDLKIAEVLRFVGLSKYTDIKAKKLNIFQQRCLSIGIALYHNPDLLVFDDLLRGLDEASRVSVCELLLKIRAMGKTVLLSARSLLDLQNICSCVGLLDSGRIQKEYTPDTCLPSLHLTLPSSIYNPSLLSHDSMVGKMNNLTQSLPVH